MIKFHIFQERALVGRGRHPGQGPQDPAVPVPGPGLKFEKSGTGTGTHLKIRDRD